VDQWWLGLPATAQGAIIAFVLLPYIGLVTGRIVPRWIAERMAETWKELYTGSETVRVRGVEAMERGADAMEDTAALVKSVMEPLREHARGELP
jgi:hypothetical protein